MAYGFIYFCVGQENALRALLAAIQMQFIKFKNMNLRLDSKKRPIPCTFVRDIYRLICEAELYR